MSHRLKLRDLAGVEAIQPFGKIVQLLHIDREHFRALENGIEAVDLFHLAVGFDRIADLQSIQKLHAVCVLVTGNGEWNRRHAVFRVFTVAQHRLKHHLLRSFLSSISSMSVLRQVPSLCQQIKPCLA